MSLEPVRVLVTRLANISVFLLASFALAAPVAYAQEDEDVADNTTAAKDAPPVEEVVVTGSRLKRDTYSSISPLQVISGQVSREIGLIDAGAILQESTAASGVQVDLTFGGFVLDNGPAASTVDLRGLGASRTLFLVNGRRLAPSGVEGAPTSPDTNLIPGALVQQYEVLLDGASSVYGSDAVAGVVNVILRKDFDGLELEGYSSIPAAGESAGLQNQMSMTWGKNFDRGFVGVGAQYRDIDGITLADRKWTNKCQKHAEITTDGEIRTEDQYYSNIFGQKSPGDCAITGLAGYMTELGNIGIGTMLYEPGFSNMNIPNFSDYYMYSTPIATLGNGVTDVSFVDHNLNGNTQFIDVVPEIQTTSVMAYGEYTFEGEANLTPYFELQYNRRQSRSDNAFVAQLFPFVNALNPFNPCNPGAAGGVDCGLAYDSILDDPNYAADFAAIQGLTPAEFRDFGIVDLYSGAVGPVPVQPVVAVRGDRGNNQTDLGQIRAVAGIRGDMPYIDFGTLDNWSFDFYVSDTNSDGDSTRSGVLEDRLDYALGNYSSTGTPCENDSGEVLPTDVGSGCVPVNMFAPSLYANVANNDFASAAERTYLIGSRDFRTKYRQTVYSFYMNGDVFRMPGGDAMFGLGGEYRQDEIDSIPNDVAREGRFFGFSSDEGAVGEKSTREFFMEAELPLLANVPGAKELTINGSTRYTKDEFYGGAWTYSGKLAYRPVDSLLLRSTIGTSYRAPNMRENFLAGQTGFRTLTDPCVVPDDAFDPISGGYDPTLDQRSDEVIANCIADPNVDPFTFTNSGLQSYSTEVKSGGALDLFEEKSDSFSAGFVWEQPFTSAFDLVFGATYYQIEVRDEIIEPDAFFIVADCYNDLQGDSPFCSRISRDPATSQFELVDEGFINRDRLTARGVDLNMTVQWPTQMFGRAVDLAADFAFNRNLEVSSRILAGNTGDEIDYYQGEFGFAEWNGRSTFRADVGDFRYTWSVRYVSSVKQDAAGVDDFDNVFTGNADTCIGPENGDVNCRDIGYAENYFTHDASVYYYGDTWTVGGGVRNVFDASPPFVDATEVSSYNNVPYGSGYDIFGRTVFLNAVYNWQ